MQITETRKMITQRARCILLVDRRLRTFEITPKTKGSGFALSPRAHFLINIQSVSVAGITTREQMRHSPSDGPSFCPTPTTKKTPLWRSKTKGLVSAHEGTDCTFALAKIKKGGKRRAEKDKDW